MRQLYKVLVATFAGVIMGIGPANQIKAQTSAGQSNHVYVDDQGVMRWQNSDQEVQGFGVNYSAPFAHAFRSAQKLGVNVKKAMEADVYHFSRLGLNLYLGHRNQ